MEKSQAERSGLVLVLAVMVNAGMVWAQSNEILAADWFVQAEKRSLENLDPDSRSIHI